jgi:hypothetical protein
VSRSHEMPKACRAQHVGLCKRICMCARLSQVPIISAVFLVCCSVIVGFGMLVHAHKHCLVSACGSEPSNWCHSVLFKGAAVVQCFGCVSSRTSDVCANKQFIIMWSQHSCHSECYTRLHVYTGCCCDILTRLHHN